MLLLLTRKDRSGHRRLRRRAAWAIGGLVTGVLLTLGAEWLAATPQQRLGRDPPEPYSPLQLRLDQELRRRS